MKTIYKRGIGVVLAATMVTTGGMTAFASEATKDGSGAAGISEEVATAEVDGSQFEGEEWYDKRDIFQVNREEAHTSFTSFNALEYTHSYSVTLKPVSTNDMDASMEESKVVLP